MLSVFSIANSIFNSRTYVMEAPGDEVVWLVDCGDFGKVLECIGEKAIAGVLLTHAHFDHIYGMPALLERFPRCRIVTNETGRDALGDAKRNLSHYNGTPVALSPEPDAFLLVREGDRVALFDGVEARIYETPGHDPGCLTFAVGDYLFVGDAYIPGEKVITNLPGGDKALAAESVARIRALTPTKTLCPGHGGRIME